MPGSARTPRSESESLSAEQLRPGITTFQERVPVLTLKSENEILRIQLQLPAGHSRVKKVKINLEGTTDIEDIETVRLVYLGNTPESEELRPFGEPSPAAPTIVFSDDLSVNEPQAFLKVLVRLRDGTDLLHSINAFCEFVETDAGTIHNREGRPAGLRVGMALRQHGDDSVDTYRIPGLVTTRDGSLLAIYDVRRESSRDLQGNIDIGLSRSTDGGQSWEPMLIVLDKGSWGGLPEKFNGVSDACILVDRNSNSIFVAGLWMYGVINSEGQWLEGLTEASTDWNHQWRDRGSQPGFGVRQSSQFLITKSTDDGRTWSEPVNITRMCKKEGWWLLAPAPGHGITLEDGTLVFPTQGRDENGNRFSSITWSKDGGETWKTSKPASFETNENMVVQLGDGSIMLNARYLHNRGDTSDRNGRVISVTRDLGETWTEHPTSRNALIEPTCMASLHRHDYIENGQKKRILLFSNPSSRTTRDHITIKVSFDDGETWPEEYWLLLDEGRGRGYSCLTSIDEQTIGILYEGSRSDLTFQKIALDDLIRR